ncbi:MAG: biopolymer transporter ExbD [Sneathiella sp.]
MKSPTSSQSELEATENTLPLINIVFLMLIFFMITGRITPNEAVEIVPPVSAQNGQVPQDKATITLDPDGAIFLGSTPTDIGGLRTYLAAQNPEDTEIIVRADGAVSGVKAVAVLQMIRKSGHKNIRLLTKENKQ